MPRSWLRSSLPNPMDVPGVLSGLGLHPNEAVVLGELVRLLGAKLVDQERVRETTPVGVVSVKTPNAATDQLSFGEAA